MLKNNRKKNPFVHNSTCWLLFDLNRTSKDQTQKTIDAIQHHPYNLSFKYYIINTIYPNTFIFRSSKTFRAICMATRDVVSDFETLRRLIIWPQNDPMPTKESNQLLSFTLYPALSRFCSKVFLKERKYCNMQEAFFRYICTILAHYFPKNP